MSQFNFDPDPPLVRTRSNAGSRRRGPLLLIAASIAIGATAIILAVVAVTRSRHEPGPEGVAGAIADLTRDVVGDTSREMNADTIECLNAHQRSILSLRELSEWTQTNWDARKLAEPYEKEQESLKAAAIAADAKVKAKWGSRWLPLGQSNPELSREWQRAADSAKFDVADIVRKSQLALHLDLANVKKDILAKNPLTADPVPRFDRSTSQGEAAYQQAQRLLPAQLNLQIANWEVKIAREYEQAVLPTTLKAVQKAHDECLRRTREFEREVASLRERLNK